MGTTATGQIRLPTGDVMSETVRRIPDFSDLAEQELNAIAERMVRLDLKRGEELLHEGDLPDAVFVVLSGRFLAFRKSVSDPLTEISAGELLGETGFFSGRPRNATVIAARDSAVAKLTRSSFDEIVAEHPKIYQVILNSLARRLAEMSARVPAITRGRIARTIAIIAGRPGQLLPSFVNRLRSVFCRRSRTLILDESAIADRFPNSSLDHPVVSDWLNQCENEYDLVIYLCDGTASAWTHKAVRQADQVVIAVHGKPNKHLNAAEELVLLTHPQTHRRLVVVHERRNVTAAGTVATDTPIWLANRPVFQHHHVSVEDDIDISRLHRFLIGQAIGFVAGGGGGYGPAHAGIFKAFLERGVTFDIVGGTSVGASVMAGFAMLRSAERVDDDTEAIFISSRAFKRRTFPRYSLLDHVPFDDALRRGTNEIEIDDAWLPFFAVATDLSASRPYLFRTGPLWRAMRASGSIPGILPPMFTADGRMLVDGGLVDNIPLKPMHSLKAGPNVVVHFGLPKFEAFPIDYGTIPGRWPLLARMIFSRHKLPPVPGPINILRRCLFANDTFDNSLVGPHDLILAPPAFPGSSFMDFDRHTEVVHASYRWAEKYIGDLMTQGDPAMAALVQASK